MVAVCLSFDAMMNQFVSGQLHQLCGPIATVPFLGLLTLFLRELSPTLLWFSFAWLMVSGNTRRWIGILGLAVYLTIDLLNNFLIFPAYMYQWQSTLPTPVPYSNWYYVGGFALRILHAAFVFLCVSLMHVVGYRWDIHRPSTP